MKILCVSLLRVGDFFQVAPSFVHRAKTGESIHVLVNSQYRFLSTMYPQLQFHWFPRELLQSILVRQDCSTLSAVQILADFADLLGRQNFDRIENWTNNYLSARLLDLFDADEKRGVFFENGKVSNQTDEVNYFNEIWTRDEKPSKILVDALHESLNVDWPALPFEENRNMNKMAPIYLQVTTSDDKKNWPLVGWLKLFQMLSNVAPTKIICAPFEVPLLVRSGFFREQDLLVCQFEQARESLREAKLLISGDTSMLHLAAETLTPSIGIFLGPANPYKTAPRLAGAKIFWGKTSCAPCSPRRDCERVSHVCAEQIDVISVYEAAMSKLEMAHVAKVKSTEPKYVIYEVIESFDGSARVVPVTPQTSTISKLNEKRRGNT